MSASFKWVWGCLFWVWMKWGNLAGSRMKKTGVLLNTQSQLPSSVFNLIANPRGSRAVSAEPFSPPTVENRTVALTFLPTDLKRDWEVMSLRSWVTSKYPWAPAPLAWTWKSSGYFKRWMNAQKNTHNTLRDTLTIKVSEEIDVVEILQYFEWASIRGNIMNMHTLEQKRPIDARTLSGVWFRDWSTVRSGVSHCSMKERKVARL